MKYLVLLWCALLIAITTTDLQLVGSPSLAHALDASFNAPSIVGTWKGESICVGVRPACKDEKVVYRFEQIPGVFGILRLLADKIIDNERIPMYQADFQYDNAKGTLSSEFRRGNTHGIWKYKLNDDTLEGTLVILPDESVGRRVRVKRAAEKDVPAAPARELYN